MARLRPPHAVVPVLLALVLTLLVAPTPASAAPAGERCSRDTGPVFYAPGAGKTVSLSFDDGPTRFTPQVLRVLRAHHVRATFFMTGRQAAARPQLLRQVVAEGHLVAGHSYDHDYPGEVRGGWSRKYVGRQMDRTNRVLSAATGGPICFFRPPGGNQTPGMYAAARARGTQVVLWSVSTSDWAQPAVTTEAATRNIVRRAVAGASQDHPSVLMHDGKGSHEPESEVSSNRSNTVAALPKIIAFYRSRGYRFVDAAGRSGLPPQAARINLAADPTTVPAATRSALHGTVAATTGPVARQDLVWLSRRDGARRWRRGGVVTTRSDGSFRLGVRPAADTEYRLLLSASSRFRRATAEVTVSTYTLATDLVVTGPAEITAGDTVTLEVSVTSGGEPRAGVRVLVRRDVDGAALTDRLRTDVAGQVTFTDTPGTTTSYAFEVRKRLPHRAGQASHVVTVGPAPDSPT